MNKDLFLVRFTVEVDNSIKGTIVEDYERRHRPYYKRSKIVFIYGYRKEKFTNWKGDLPKNGEVWFCEGRTESEKMELNKGFITVSLKVNTSEIVNDPVFYKAIKLIKDWPLIDLWNIFVLAFMEFYKDTPILAFYYLEAFELLLEKSNKSILSTYADAKNEVWDKSVIFFIKEYEQDRELLLKFIKAAIFKVYSEFRDSLGSDRFRNYYFASLKVFAQDKDDDRHFYCPFCSSLHKVSKSERNIYRSGQSVRIRCSICFMSGVIFSQENLEKTKEKEIIKKQVGLSDTEKRFKDFVANLNQQSGR